MTEAEWFASNDPLEMLDTVRHRVTERKLRLFTCACCRRFLHLMPDKRSQGWLEVAELFADEQASQHERQTAWNTTIGVHGDHTGWALLDSAVNAATGVARNLPRVAAASTESVSEPQSGVTNDKRKLSFSVILSAIRFKAQLFLLNG